MAAENPAKGTRHECANKRRPAGRGPGVALDGGRCGLCRGLVAGLRSVDSVLGSCVVSLLPVDRHSHTGEALAFFFYDVPKVMLLLS